MLTMEGNFARRDRTDTIILQQQQCKKFGEKGWKERPIVCEKRLPTPCEQKGLTRSQNLDRKLWPKIGKKKRHEEDLTTETKSLEMVPQDLVGLPSAPSKEVTAEAAVPLRERTLTAVPVSTRKPSPEQESLRKVRPLMVFNCCNRRLGRFRINHRGLSSRKRSSQIWSPSCPSLIPSSRTAVGVRARLP